LLAGVTYFTAAQVEDLIEEWEEFWPGNLYEPFSHNCNNFSRTLIKHLVHEE